jgi:hypothetical protein
MLPSSFMGEFAASSCASLPCSARGRSGSSVKRYSKINDRGGEGDILGRSSGSPGYKAWQWPMAPLEALDKPLRGEILQARTASSNAPTPRMLMTRLRL